VVGVRHSPGAAGTVVCNLVDLGVGQLHAVGMTGGDGEAYDLRNDLGTLGCDTAHLHYDHHRYTPTYLKPRDGENPGLGGEHSRYDTKNRTPTPRRLEGHIIASLDALLPQLDAVILADQVEEEDCGTITAAVRRFIAHRAPRWPKVVFWADSRRRIRLFRHAIVKPNQFEAVGRDCPRPGDEVPLAELEAAIAALRAETTAPVVVTRGAAGMVVSDPQCTIVPGVRVEGPTDPTGAGDSATAGAVSALAAGATLAEAALVGNLVASITVQQLATTGTARPELLPPRLAMWQSQRA
jgi:sugar/nucleoside kinase (ribokinase family)